MLVLVWQLCRMQLVSKVEGFVIRSSQPLVFSISADTATGSCYWLLAAAPAADPALVIPDDLLGWPARQ